jgi:hypothetical protein
LGKNLAPKAPDFSLAITPPNHTRSTTAASSNASKPRSKFRIVKEPEEVRRARLAYPDPSRGSKSDRDESREKDWNERKAVDRETSLGKRVAVRMREVGRG